MIRKHIVDKGGLALLDYFVLFIWQKGAMGVTTIALLRFKPLVRQRAIVAVERRGWCSVF